MRYFVMLIVMSLWGILTALLGQTGPSADFDVVLLASNSTAEKQENVIFAVEFIPQSGKELNITGIEPVEESGWKLVAVQGLPLKTAGSTAVVTLTMQPLNEGKSRPMVVVKYTGLSGEGSRIATSDWIEVRPAAMTAPGIDWNGMAPLLAGAGISLVATIVVSLLNERIKNGQQKRKNREQVHSLLDMISDGAHYAAAHGTEMSLTDAESIYRTEGLYTILHEHGLEEDLRQVVDLGRQHNHYLDKRQSLHHATDLAQAATRLQNSLRDFNHPSPRFSDRVRGWMRRGKAKTGASASR